ncbi:hypothetical protein CBOS2020_02410 [Clostridium botulinum]|nr:hypothetical protein CBOS2020_02410 [Clostridium botulinum]
MFYIWEMCLYSLYLNSYSQQYTVEKNTNIAAKPQNKKLLNVQFYCISINESFNLFSLTLSCTTLINQKS